MYLIVKQFNDASIFWHNSFIKKQKNVMLKRNPQIFAVLLALPILSSCDAIAGIFKAGMWTGFIIVALVIAIIIWIIAKVTKK